jgi:hypothetical protein
MYVPLVLLERPWCFDHGTSGCWFTLKVSLGLHKKTKGCWPNTIEFFIHNLTLGLICRVKTSWWGIPIRGLGWGHSWVQPHILGMSRPPQLINLNICRGGCIWGGGYLHLLLHNAMDLMPIWRPNIPPTLQV